MPRNVEITMRCDDLGAVRAAALRLGAHGAEILREIGYPPGRIAALVGRG